MCEHCFDSYCPTCLTDHDCSHPPSPYDFEDSPRDSGHHVSLYGQLEATLRVKEESGGKTFYMPLDDDVWARLNSLTIMSRCYVTDDDGEERRYGTDNDWACLAEDLEAEMPNGIFIFDVVQKETRQFCAWRNNVSVHGSDAIRILTTQSAMGIVVNDDELSHLEIWSRDGKKSRQRNVLDRMWRTVVMRALAANRPVVFK